MFVLHEGLWSLVLAEKKTCISSNVILNRISYLLLQNLLIVFDINSFLNQLIATKDLLFFTKQLPPNVIFHLPTKIGDLFQGRTALWDALLLLCHRIKAGYGGIVRGVHLGSSAFNLLPVLDSNDES